MSKVIVGGLGILFLAPAAVLLPLTALLNPAAEASCLPTTSAMFTVFSDGSAASSPPVGESSRVVFPLPKGTWIKTSAFGMRRHPNTGVYKRPRATAYTAPSRPRPLPPAAGHVSPAGPSGGHGHKP